MKKTSTQMLLGEEAGGRSQTQLQGLQGAQFSREAGGRIRWDRHSENSWQNGLQLSLCLLCASGTPTSMDTQQKCTQRMCPWVFTGSTQYSHCGPKWTLTKRWPAAGTREDSRGTAQQSRDSRKLHRTLCGNLTDVN